MEESSRKCLCGHSKWKHEMFPSSGWGRCTEIIRLERCNCQKYVSAVGLNAWQRYERRFATSVQDTISFSDSSEHVWSAVPNALNGLGWKIEMADSSSHRIRARTKASPFAWSSTLIIDVLAIDANTSRIHVVAKTIQARDQGRTRKRIDLFFQKLQEQPFLTVLERPAGESS